MYVQSGLCVGQDYAQGSSPMPPGKATKENPPTTGVDRPIPAYGCSSLTGTVEVAWKRPRAIVLARNGSYSLKASWVHREDNWLASQNLGLRKGEAFLALGSRDHSHLGLLLAQILGCF